MNPSQPTIFVQITAYRDPDLPATLQTFSRGRQNRNEFASGSAFNWPTPTRTPG
ncbi:MAG: hypothetical protein AAEC03_01955 [Synechococcus sp.]